ncbi:hypothetical protein [Vibrio scophthalmi]|uniref:Uncharacterized protein n=1 Tax=Vibrio scophthalmi LMG 19158 TaxID=870967 RepID=F9RNA6_9VIBR|nr:hypothetical protein [Vibrio scophthalmi]EGU37251.1 hypothetical protein VIS19158_03552 [Vibrio scophthalmi LMG 19158]
MMSNDNPQLRHNIALKGEDAVFGLPLPLFAFALVVSVFGTGLLIKSLNVLLGLFFGALLTLAVFKPLQLIHKNDLQAWRIWQSVIRTPRFSSNQMKRKKVLIQTSNSQCLDFQQWRNKR